MTEGWVSVYIRVIGGQNSDYEPEDSGPLGIIAACGKREPVFLFDPSRCLSEEPEWAEQER